MTGILSAVELERLEGNDMDARVSRELLRRNITKRRDVLRRQGAGQLAPDEDQGQQWDEGELERLEDALARADRHHKDRGSVELPRTFAYRDTHGDSAIDALQGVTITGSDLIRTEVQVDAVPLARCLDDVKEEQKRMLQQMGAMQVDINALRAENGQLRDLLRDSQRNESDVLALLDIPQNDAYAALQSNDPRRRLKTCHDAPAFHHILQKVTVLQDCVSELIVKLRNQEQQPPPAPRPAPRPATTAAAPAYNGPPWLGLEIQNLSDAAGTGLQGVNVKWSDPRGPAKSANINQGDVISAIDHQPVHSRDGFKARISKYQAGDTIVLTLYPGGSGYTNDVSVQLMPRPQG